MTDPNINLFLENHGQVLIGGSQALYEAGPYSDVDYYVVCSLRNAFKIIKNKQLMRSVDEQVQTPVSYIILPKILLKLKFYYLYGIDKLGKTFTVNYDKVLTRNNSLKLAYREFIEAKFLAGSQLNDNIFNKKKYHLAKALLHVLYANLLFEKNSQFKKEPLFSVNRIICHLKDLINDSSVPLQIKILNWKMAKDDVRPTLEDEKLVLQKIEKLYEKFLRKSFSWRSYILYNLFALLKKNFTYLLKNPDKYIIAQFRKALLNSDRSLFEQTKKDTFKMVII